GLQEHGHVLQMPEERGQVERGPAVVGECVDGALVHLALEIRRPSGGSRGEDVDFGTGFDQRVDDVAVASIQRRHQGRFAVRQPLSGEQKILGQERANLPQIPCLRGFDQRLYFSHTSQNRSDIGYRISDIGYRISGIGYRVSGIGYRTSGIGYRVSDLDHRGTLTVRAPGTTRTATRPRARPISPSR